MSTRKKPGSRIRKESIKRDAFNETGMNSSVTDSVSQADTEVVSVVSAASVGSLFQSNAQSLSLAALNATNAQQQNTITAQTTANVGLTTLYSIDIATDTTGTSDILSLAPKK